MCSSSSAGPRWQRATRDVLKKFFFLISVCRQDVSQYVASCTSRARNKAASGIMKGHGVDYTPWLRARKQRVARPHCCVLLLDDELVRGTHNVTQVDQLVNTVAATLMSGAMVDSPRGPLGSNDKIVSLLIRFKKYICSMTSFPSLINPAWHNEHYACNYAILLISPLVFTKWLNNYWYRDCYRD